MGGGGAHSAFLLWEEQSCARRQYKLCIPRRVDFIEELRNAKSFANSQTAKERHSVRGVGV